MIKHDKGRLVFREFESVEDNLASLKLSEFNKNHNTAWIFAPGGGDRNFRQDWYTGGDFAPKSGESMIESFRRFVHDGWAAGVKMMREKISKLPSPKIKSIRRRARWTSEGDEVDIHRVYSGHLDEAWRGTEKRLSDGGTQYVRIGVDINLSAAHSKEDFFWAGAAACLLTDVLEDAGYRVEVVQVVTLKDVTSEGSDSGRGYGSQNYQSFVRLKDFDEPLNIERLAALTAHPGAFRVLSFATMMSLAGKWTCGSFGRCEIRRPDEFEPKDIYITDLSGAERTKSFLVETLKKFDFEPTLSHP